MKRNWTRDLKCQCSISLYGNSKSSTARSSYCTSKNEANRKSPISSAFRPPMFRRKWGGLKNNSDKNLQPLNHETMQETELIAMWRSYDQKLEENLTLNRKNAEAITLIKIKSLINSMAPMKIFIIIASVLWITFLGVVLYRTYSFASVFFWWSIFIHVVLLAFVIGVYVYQLVLIFQTDISEPLVETQHRLASLTSSTLLVSRLMFLHAPIWTTFSISEKMYEHPVWLTLQVLITLVFA